MAGTRITVLTFNIFTGTPVSFLGHPTLVGSDRLKGQLKRIKEIDADVVFLQEVYDNEIFSIYEEHFHGDYQLFHERAQPVACYFLYATVLSALALFFSVLLQLLDGGLLDDVPVTYMAVGSFILAECVTRLEMLRALKGFVFGDILGAQVIMFKTAKFARLPASDSADDSEPAALPHVARFFDLQSGDPINMFRPRGFLVLPLLYHGGESEARALPLVLAALHTNSGKNDASRVPQTREVVEHVNAMCERVLRATSVDTAMSTARGASTTVQPRWRPPPTAAVTAVAAAAQEGVHQVAVLSGCDLNATAADASVQQLFEYGRFVDTWPRGTAGRHGSPGFTWDNVNTICATGLRKIPDERVDFLLHRGPVTVRECRLALHEPPFLSDHFGVLGEFTVGA